MYISLRNETVITKKPHQCAWCGEQIDKGNIAEYRVYIYDGDFGHDWTHPECTGALREMDLGEDFTFSPGEFTRGKTHA